MFVSAIKKYLVLALCTNALYAYAVVTDLTLRIFVLLLTVFAANLKVRRPGASLTRAPCRVPRWRRRSVSCVPDETPAAWRIGWPC